MVRARVMGTMSRLPLASLHTVVEAVVLLPASLRVVATVADNLKRVLI
jgi:hypothetical protein